MGGERKSLGRFVKKGETGCHAALNSRTDARPIFQHCPLFHCRFIALKSRTFVVKSRTTFAIKFVRDLNAKSTPMGDCGEAAWGVALHRESVIRRLAEHPRLSSERIAEAANQLG